MLILRISALALLFLLTILFLAIAELVSAHADPTFQQERRKRLNYRRNNAFANDIGVPYEVIQKALQKGENLKEIMQQSKLPYHYFQMH